MATNTVRHEDYDGRGYELSGRAAAEVIDHNIYLCAIFRDAE